MRTFLLLVMLALPRADIKGGDKLPDTGAKEKCLAGCINVYSVCTHQCADITDAEKIVTCQADCVNKFELCKHSCR